MKQIPSKSKKNQKKKAVKKTANIKKDKQFHFSKILKKILIILLACGLAIVFIIFSGLFNIKEFIIEGNEHITNDEIISYSKVAYGENIFAVNKNDTESNVRENSYVKNVNVKKVFPNKIKITVEERGTEYIAQIANSYCYINRQGYILEISESKIEVPELIGLSTNLENKNPNDMLDEKDLKKLKKVNNIKDMAEKKELLDKITKIDVTNGEDIILNLESIGKKVYIGNGENLNERFLYVKAIIKEQEGKNGEIFVNVDLNNEDVYFREN